MHIKTAIAITTPRAKSATARGTAENAENLGNATPSSNPSQPGSHTRGECHYCARLGRSDSSSDSDSAAISTNDQSDPAVENTSVAVVAVQCHLQPVVS